MIEVEVGFEVRRYCTTRIQVERMKDVDAVINKLVQRNSNTLNWDEISEIDSVDILGEYPDVDDISPIYDIAYEEQRDAKLHQRLAG